ncbi:MAG: toxin co-regulated pilus biosynthesis Q family protein [Paraburkholderia sp.]|jgi:hypothetical protein|uniref:toxin co-regulated pilus biosynthesis Q family protein n=1 Tax=Burkholderiaceae TaxID=119060 RepID=UPI0010F624E8|nr:toxin co-regulated pilus biosynthesis Q family protein [Burkholderia sp. 4M9327F10]
MTKNLTIPYGRRTLTVTRILAALVLAGLAFGACASVSSAADPDQSRLAAPAGDGWQVLSASAASPSAAAGVSVLGGPASATPATASAPPPGVSLAVTPVVVAGDGAPSTLSLSITPQDTNLRNALDRWLQGQGWQLAWKIDDDLPLEFNATFSGDFTSVLTQVMQATNHMRTPTRICRHTNHVIRVIARAATCKD